MQRARSDAIRKSQTIQQFAQRANNGYNCALGHPIVKTLHLVLHSVRVLLDEQIYMYIFIYIIFKSTVNKQCTCAPGGLCMASFNKFYALFHLTACGRLCSRSLFYLRLLANSEQNSPEWVRNKRERERKGEDRRYIEVGTQYSDGIYLIALRLEIMSTPYRRK